jgi:hypothetical protein
LLADRSRRRAEVTEVNFIVVDVMIYEEEVARSAIVS